MADLTAKESRRLDVLLEDSKIRNSEIRAAQVAQRRMKGFTFVALGVGLPVLINAITDQNHTLVISVLVGFAFASEFVFLSYVGLTRGILRLSNYEAKCIIPEVNRLIGDGKNDLFAWEQYLRMIRAEPIEYLGAVLLQLGELALTLGPSMLCIGIAIGFAVQNDLVTTLFVIFCVAYAVVLFTVLGFFWNTGKRARKAMKWQEAPAHGVADETAASYLDEHQG